MLHYKVSTSKGGNVIPKTGFLITSLLLTLLFIPQAIAIDYIEDLLDPSDRVAQPPEVPSGFDFDDVIFTREYFYSVTHGIIQYRNTGTGLWNTLDLNLNTPSPEQELRSTPPESIPRPSEDVRSQITKEGVDPQPETKKTREQILRELEKSVGVPRY